MINVRDMAMNLRSELKGNSLAQNRAITVDGDWGPWSAWSSCSISCGQGGNHKRTRACDNPVPIGTGKSCVGNGYQSKGCVDTEVCSDSGMLSKRINVI